MAIDVQQGTAGNRRQLSVASGRCTAYINEPPTAGGAVNDARELEVAFSGRTVGCTVEPCIFWRLELPDSNVPEFVLASQYQTSVGTPRSYYFSARIRQVPEAQVTRELPGENLATTVREAGQARGAYLGNGSRLRFRTSACTNDQYIVRFFREREQAVEDDEGSSALATVTIIARRKIHYEYVQMARSSGGGHYSLTSYRGQNVLQSGVAHLRDRIGIELVQQGTVNYAHQNASFFAPSGSLFNYARGQPAAAAVAAGSIPDRQISIVALDALPPRSGAPVPGAASGNVAAVACGYLEGQSAGHTVVFATLLHEIGHTFGLVPSGSGSPPHYSYGGVTRQAWRSSYGQHCDDTRCFMTHSVDGPTGAGRTPLQTLTAGDPITSFCGDDIFPGTARRASGDCGSFLRIVPLTGRCVTIGTG